MIRLGPHSSADAVYDLIVNIIGLSIQQCRVILNCIADQIISEVFDVILVIQDIHGCEPVRLQQNIIIRVLCSISLKDLPDWEIARLRFELFECPGIVLFFDSIPGALFLCRHDVI